MRSYGYDDTTIAKAMDLHDGTTAKVKWGGKRSEPVPTSWGVEQGAPASNPLWNPYADLICRQTIADCGPNAGIQIYHQPTTQLGGFPDLPPDPTIVYLHSLLLADDIVVLADSAAQLQTFLLHLEKNCKRWGMRISKEKTKLMTFGASAATPAAWSPICIDGSPLEVVDAYKYLGSWFSESCTLDKELSVRIGHAIAAAVRLRNIWRYLDVLRGGLPNGLPWIQATFDKRAWKNFVLGNFDTSPQAPAPAPPFQGPPGLPIAGDRTLVRMGLAPNNLLLPGVPDRRPYTPPSGPYTGAPRGRPRGSGKRSRRGRRPGSSVSRAGRSEDEGVVPSVHSDGSTLFLSWRRYRQVLRFLLVSFLTLFLTYRFSVYFSK
ncbi:hypothetical protein NADE_000473 [Nannochloris sp. 'desiccata']|nr:hypothetical protein NADE_000473 [Chlorella desiccata (nom. nud.)]